MKNIITIVLLFISFNLYSQKIIKIEDLITDSLHIEYFKIHIEECTPLQIRYGKKNFTSCPIFWDKLENYFFYIDFTEGKLDVVTLSDKYLDYVD